MAPLQMPRFALAFLAVFGAAVQAESEVPWPEHGSIKVGIPKSPVQLNLELPGCLKVSIDWKSDQVRFEKAGDSQASPIDGTDRMREDGGQLVTLFTLEDNKAHIIVYTEVGDGSLDTRMTSVPISGCPLSKLHISSPTPEALKDVSVGVSDEIRALYLQRMGATA